ncbi:MAG: dihydrofolate reductase family protein [Chloroflexi bacterium]|nr:dihydrofolate reductase family protein [Chloroflexota bacterium]
MSKVTANMSMSLDGFIAGPHDDVERLHEWMFPPRGNFQQVLDEMFKTVGAIIMGSRMFKLGEEPWGNDPPFHMPAFVLTHEARPVLVKEGGTTFTFVDDGIESALKQARAAADDKDVMVTGGANAIQQYINMGVLEEIRIHMIPVLLGDGIPLFDNLGDMPIELEQVEVIEGQGVTHLRYRVVK